MAELTQSFDGLTCCLCKSLSLRVKYGLTTSLNSPLRPAAVLHNPTLTVFLLLSNLLLHSHFSGLAVGQADTKSVQIGETQFTIPANMQLELVAGEPLTTWPMLADWDSQGRLLLVESGGVSKPIEEHNKKLLHRIVRLEDSTGDGHFDSRTVVAQDLPFTEGVLCIGRDLLVSAPPSIYRLIDEDQDGIYESREVWFDGQTITGCANDLHGPYLGRDGWIYWCKGAFAEQHHELLSGHSLSTSAAHIFRRRLAGGAIEPVMTGGMDNPVAVAVTPEGERFFTSTFLHAPGQSPGLRDGIAHAVYGGLYGKVHPKVTDGHVRTGDLMPIMVELGAAAPSGIACLSSTQLLPQQTAGERTLVAALFNLQKVTAHRLQPTGASFQSLNSDLVVADRIDFHPTDVLEDADGSLLIIDTGGWYDLCCPSSRVDQKTAAGGVYRLSANATSSPRSSTPSAQPRSPTADTSAVDVAQLAQRLLDARPWVAHRAQLQLVKLSEATGRTQPAQRELAESIVSVLQNQLQDSRLELDQRLASLWGLCAWGDERALATIAKQLDSSQDSLLQAACHAVSLHRYAAAKPQLEELLKHANLQVSRAAAEGLGRIGDHNSARALLEVLDGSHADARVWEHSITYALIELQAIDQALKYLASTAARQPSNHRSESSPSSALNTSGTPGDSATQRKRIAMQVIDQLAAAQRLSVDMLLDGLSSREEPYRQTASQILAKHPQWAPSYQAAIAELYLQAVPQTVSPSEANDSVTSNTSDALQTIVAGWRDTATVQQLMKRWIEAAPTSSPAQQQRLVALLAAYANSNLPTDWIAPLAHWLELASAADRLAIANQLAELKLPGSSELNSSLIKLASSTDNEAARLQFLAALPPNASLSNPTLERAILSALESPDANSDREDDDREDQTRESVDSLSNAAMTALQRVRLSIDSGRYLLESLSRQSARQLPLVVEAISRVGDDALDADLLQQLASLPAARTLAEGQVLNLYRSRSSALQQAAQAAVTAMSQPDSDIQEKIDTVLSQLKPGDPVRGLQLFRSSKTACSACHKLGYVGGEIGPDLTRIGSSRTRPALLEAILFPSARLEQSYQSTKILTHDGQVYNGLITRHLSPTQFEIQLSADKSIVLSTEDVARQELSEVSIMPSGLADLLTLDELSDLMAILQSAK